MVADIQYCDSDPHGERYFRQSLEKLSEAVACFQREQPDFVVQLGDFIDREFASFAPVAEIWNRLDMPAYHVLGNHDFLVEPEEKTKILALLNLERGYYDFSYASWRFIVLDGNELSFYAPPESSERYAQAKHLFTRIENEHRLNAQTWNGGISHQQLEWLQQKLEYAFARGEEVIVFCHFPVLPLDIHTLWNDRDVIAVLERSPAVKAYINGHNHAGNYIEHQGIHYLNIHGMVETEESNAYAIVEIYSDHLRVIGTGREPTRILPIKK
ncbi:phosphatase [candidate division KSB3 bacterium]|uniref:Phosphatase n=1 Tax=candidate division KSB3 bacterium TaxID=2044937 RepID=A0A2G6E0H0_9BACT|nr:MAG: phosphatase [candidate division KSB3 bacterium]